MCKGRSVFAVFLILAVAAESALAGQNIHDWGNAQKLEIDSGVQVITKRGERYQGTVNRVTADTLSVTVRVPRAFTEIKDFRKDEIQEVRSRHSPPASALIGAGIGLGIGLGLGAVADAQSKTNEDRGLATSLFGMLGAALGAGIGKSNPIKAKRFT